MAAPEAADRTCVNEDGTEKRRWPSHECAEFVADIYNDHHPLAAPHVAYPCAVHEGWHTGRSVSHRRPWRGWARVAGNVIRNPAGPAWLWWCHACPNRWHTAATEGDARAAYLVHVEQEHR